MSELNKLFGKGKKIKLGELEIEIKPLTVSAMPVLMGVASEDEKVQAQAMKDVINLTLKEAIPDATDDEIDKLPLEYVLPLVDEIMTINKMEELNPDKKALLENLKK